MKKPIPGSFGFVKTLLVTGGWVFFCLLGILAAGASAEEKLRGKIAVQPIQEDDDLRGKKFDHPVKLDSRELKKIIWNLHFARRLSDLWQDPERIFDKKTVRLIAEHFRKKFQTIKSSEIIHFSLRTPKGRTTGDLFVLNDALNWRFSMIKGMEYDMDSQSVEQESGGELLVNWKLAPQKGQSYFITANLLGMKKAVKVWITVPLKNRTKLKTRSDAGIKEKLKLLKELREENLISRQDYEEKVKELLKDL